MQRNIFSKIMLAVLLIFAFLSITSCSEYKEQPQESTETGAPQFNDTAYKLFYGEWEISKVAGTDERFPPDLDVVQQEVGKKIIYSEDKVILDGKEIIENPNYSIAIIPVRDPRRQYIAYMPPLNEIGINGDYFVFVHVLNSVGNYVTDIGTMFYIKDDNTLIMYDDGGTYFEMKRIAHIKDAELGERYF
ncbi:hypothetical protein ABEW34_11880 [Paenibacillus algorifonticola]|uniref:hypothetical protein n=1 Tax=Paenibacillus algorifonticola TaxID=684063 RepID=UPI003D2BFEC1